MLFSTQNLSPTSLDGQLNSYSFQITQPQLIGLLGINGAGKSTLLHLLAGGQEQFTGDALLLGHSLSKAKRDYQQKVGYVVDNLTVPKHMTVSNFLQFMAHSKNIKNHESSIQSIIEELSLTDLINKPVQKLSLGQKQRVNVAQALINNPELLLLDEPLNGLDPNQQHLFWDLLKRSKSRAAIILASHHVHDLLEYCDRIMIVDQHTLVFDQCIRNDEQYYVLSRPLAISQHDSINCSDEKISIDDKNRSEQSNLIYPQICRVDDERLTDTHRQEAIISGSLRHIVLELFSKQAQGLWQWQ